MHRRNLFLITALLVMVAAMIGAVLLSEGGDPPSGPDASEVRNSAAGTPATATGRAPEAADPAAADDAGRREVAEAGTAALSRIRWSGRLVAAGTEDPVPDVELSWHSRFGPGDDFEVFGGPPEMFDSPTVRTDTEGRFTLDMSAGRRGTLQLTRAANLLFADTGSRRIPLDAQDADGALGDVEVSVAASITGRVVDEGGTPIPGARVRANPSTGLLWAPGRGIVTAEDGTFTLTGLRGGKHRIGASAPGFVPGLHEIELEIGQLNEAVDVVLTRGRSIAGTVIDDRGAPIEGAKVTSFRARDVSPGVRVKGYDTSEAAETDANGYFVLSGIDTERATLRASDEGHAPDVSIDVEAGTGDVVLRLRRLGSVAGILRDTAGQPIEGSRVSASASTDAGIPHEASLGLLRAFGAETAVTDADGRFEIAGVPPGTVNLTARGDGHLPVEGRTIQLSPGMPTTNVLLVAEVGAGLAVLVVEADGSPVAGARVATSRPPSPEAAGVIRRALSIGVGDESASPDADVFVMDDEGGRLATGVTDAEGRVTLAGLPTGSGIVTAEHDEFAPAKPVELALPRHGVLEVVVTLRPAGLLALRTLDASGEAADGVRWMLRGPAGEESEERRGVSDALGHGRIDQLLEGSYELFVELEPPGMSFGGVGGMVMLGGGGEVLESSRVTVAVRAGEVTDVELRQPMLTRILGALTDAAGPVVGATVRLLRDDAGPMPAAGRSTKTDGDGHYEIGDVTPGSYRLEFGRAGQVVPHEESVDVPPGAPELVHDLRLTGGTLRVSVVDAADGRPMSGALIEVQRPGGAARPRVSIMMIRTEVDEGSGAESIEMTPGAGRARSGSDGVAVVEDVPPGTYSIRVTYPDRGTQTIRDVEVLDGQVHQVGPVSMARGGGVRGSLVGLADGDPVRGALIEVRTVGEDGEPRREPAMGGSFTIGELPAGSYELRARALSTGPGGDFGPWTPAEVRAGEFTEIELSVR